MTDRTRLLTRVRGGERLSVSRIALLYLAGITLAEAFTAMVEPRAGLALHGLVLLGLILHASLWAHGTTRRFLLALTLAPLIRLMSLALPLPKFPLVYWYVLVGAPLFLAAFYAARAGRMNRIMLGFTMRDLPFQAAIAVTGIGLGFLEYVILRPAPLASGFRLDLIWLPALILLIFTGLLEEFIFRGLLQYSAQRSLGKGGLAYTAAVFAVLHMGYRSWLDVVFVFAVAMYFGWAVQRSKSILGVTLAHGLTNIGLFLIFPFLLAPPAATQVQTPLTAIPLTGALVSGAMITATGVPRTSAPAAPSPAVITATLVVLAPSEAVSDQERFMFLPLTLHQAPTQAGILSPFITPSATAAPSPTPTTTQPPSTDT